MCQQHYEFDPLSSEFRQDRYEEFKKARTLCPIYKEIRTDQGRDFTTWHFTTYEDVLLAFRDNRFVKEIGKVLPADEIPPVPEQIKDLDRSLKNMLPFRDPPDHARLRAVVNHAFTPKIAEQLEPRIREIASYLLKEVEPGTSFDLLNNYAFLIPVYVITELLGAPKEDRELIKDWSKNLIHAIDHNPTLESLTYANNAVVEFRTYIRDLVHARSRNPQNDLLSGMIQANLDDRMSEDELLDMAVLILQGGHETTSGLLSNSVYLIARYPEQQALLRTKDTLMACAIEEILRFEPVSQLRHRIVGEEMEYKNFVLKRGDLVAAWIGSANRDGSVFSNPETFDITRRKNPHLSFGQGIHFCLGAPLARKEGAIALQLLLEKYKSIELVNEEVEWVEHPGRRSLKELIVHV